jgi:hypothetical protein
VRQPAESWHKTSRNQIWTRIAWSCLRTRRANRQQEGPNRWESRRSVCEVVKCALKRRMFGGRYVVCLTHDLLNDLRSRRGASHRSNSFAGRIDHRLPITAGFARERQRRLDRRVLGRFPRVGTIAFGRCGSISLNHAEPFVLLRMDAGCLKWPLVHARSARLSGG